MDYCSLIIITKMEIIILKDTVEAPTVVTNNIVEKQNRLKSIMVSKELLEVDSREGKVNYFIFDKGNDIDKLLMHF